MTPESLNPGLTFRNSVTSPHPEVVRYHGDQQSSTAGSLPHAPHNSVLSFISSLLISFIRTTGCLSSDVGENQIFSWLVSIGMSDGGMLRNTEQLLGGLWDQKR